MKAESRLSRGEIADLQSRLTTWLPPEEILRLVGRIGSLAYFCQSGLAFLRDAWIGAEFAKIRQLELVRLVSDIYPDFEILSGGGIERFEAVEADDPERRRGDEYRDSSDHAQCDPIDSWIARAEQTPLWLAAACQKKANKRYGARANLVVYLNVGEYGIRQREIESCFPSATASVKGSFDAVWVLWKSKAYLVWQSGEQPRRAA